MRPHTLPRHRWNCSNYPRSLLLFGIALASLLGYGQSPGLALRVCAEASNLPFSNDALEGFENRIAEVIASELEADLQYVWLDRSSALLRRTLLEQGECDMVMAAADGQAGYLTTLAYYRTLYVFVYRADAPFEVTSFDDPVLRGLRIGVQVPGGRNVSPPTQALANRGLIPNQVSFVADHHREIPLAEVIEAVADGDVDVSIAWGPVGGFLAARQPVALEVVPVSPEFDTPFLPMVFSVALGVRPGDLALRDQLNRVLANRWDEIQGILAEYYVPLLPLPKPTLTTGGP